MSFEELKKLFERYDYYTLDSLSILLDYAEKYDLGSTYSALNFVQQKKYDSMSEEFEGRNEYDYICRIGNFNISEISKSLNSLNNNELMYLYSIASNALNSITNVNALDWQIRPKIEEFIKKCSNQLESKTEVFTDEEIEVFLNKYSITELDALNIIFGYVSSYDMKRIHKIFEKVYQEKYKCEVGTTPKKISILDITAKNTSLSYKELNYLCKLVEDASLYLDSVRDFGDSYKQVIEDFDSDCYPIIGMSKLEESLHEEMDKRKQSQKKLVIKLKK